MLTITVKFYAYALLCNSLCFLGILGNTLTLYILNSCKDMRKQSINIYLTVLALYDNGVLIFSILMLNLPAITEYQQISMYTESESFPSPSSIPSMVPSPPQANLQFTTTAFNTSEHDPNSSGREYPFKSTLFFTNKLPNTLTYSNRVRSVRHSNVMNHNYKITISKSEQFDKFYEQDKSTTVSLDSSHFSNVIFNDCFNQSELPDLNSMKPVSDLSLKVQFRSNSSVTNPNLLETILWQIILRLRLKNSIQSKKLLVRPIDAWQTQWFPHIPIMPDILSSFQCQKSLLSFIKHCDSTQSYKEYSSEPNKWTLIEKYLLSIFESLYVILYGNRAPKRIGNSSFEVTNIGDQSSMASTINQSLQEVFVENNFTKEQERLFTDSIEADEQPFGLYSASTSPIQSMPISLYPLMYYVKVVYPLALISQTGSIWTTCLITIERYLAVCHPLMSLTLSTRSRAIWALSVLSAIAFLFNLPRFLEVDTTRGFIQPSDLRRNKIYYYVYYICLNLSFNYILPLSLLFALNIKIYSSVRHANANRNELTRARQSELHLASMLVAIVAIFIACNAPAFIVHCLEPYFNMGTVVLETVTIFSNVLVCFNSAVNFVIYCIFGKKFRLKLKQVLGLKQRSFLCCCREPLAKRQLSRRNCNHSERNQSRYWNSANTSTYKTTTCHRISETQCDGYSYPSKLNRQILDDGKNGINKVDQDMVTVLINHNNNNVHHGVEKFHKQNSIQNMQVGNTYV